MANKLILICVTVLIATVYSAAISEYPLQFDNINYLNQYNIKPLENPSYHHREARQAQDPNRGSVQVDINRNRGGTDVGATANAKIWESRNGNGRVDGNANYNQHFGGPAGRSKPNYGVGLTYKRRF